VPSRFFTSSSVEKSLLVASRTRCAIPPRPLGKTREIQGAGGGDGAGRLLLPGCDRYRCLAVLPGSALEVEDDRSGLPQPVAPLQQGGAPDGVPLDRAP
jgi:hypothetical protein